MRVTLSVVVSGRALGGRKQGPELGSVPYKPER
jgi:hypothetical protein